MTSTLPGKKSTKSQTTTSSTTTKLKMQRKNSSPISAEDLIEMLNGNCKTGFLRQKRATKIMKSIKWKHQFVVLANSSLYIYRNEMSKTPENSIYFQGYVAVQRETTPTCAWVFALVPGTKSLPRYSFACSNDAERKDWMQHIKGKLYIANNVKDTSAIFLSSTYREKVKLAGDLSPEERVYVELEMPVMAPEEAPGNEEKDFTDIGESDDIDVNADEEEDDVEDILGASTKSLLLDCEVERRNIGQSSNPQGQGRCQRQIEGRWSGDGETTEDDEDDDVEPDGILPPRYSAIVRDAECEYQNVARVTTKTKEVDLESTCTITDETLCRDRDKCLEMLRAAGKVGTYLIRKSRRADYKVLSVLVSEWSVREYRIEEVHGLYHIQHDPAHEFPTMSSLLTYYSHHKPLPAYQGYLGWGVHEFGANDQMYEDVVE